jgi:hypothetical protein
MHPLVIGRYLLLLLLLALNGPRDDLFPLQAFMWPKIPILEAQARSHLVQVKTARWTELLCIVFFYAVVLSAILEPSLMLASRWVGTYIPGLLHTLFSLSFFCLSKLCEFNLCCHECFGQRLLRRGPIALLFSLFANMNDSLLNFRVALAG